MAVITAVVTLAGACGSHSSGPPKIHLAGRTGAKVAAATDGIAPTPGAESMAIRPMTFVAGPGLQVPTGAQAAWTVSAPASPISDVDKASLAKAFGMTGTWSSLPGAADGSEQLTEAGGPATLDIASDVLHSWIYFSGTADSVAVSCASSTDASAPTTTCAQPTPPVGVPDQATALAKARTLFGALGYDLAKWHLSATADQWAASVTALLSLGGVASSVGAYVNFGANGAVTTASGVFAAPVKVGDYPVVDLATALSRLNDPEQRWAGWPVETPAVGVEPLVGPSTASGAATPGQAGSGGTGAGPVVAPSVAPAPPVAVDTAPVPIATPATVDSGPTPVDTVAPASGPVVTAPVETVAPLTVTLTSVTSTLALVRDVSGSVWLVPAFTFHDAQNADYTVIAVDASYFDLVAASSGPTPASGPTPSDLPVMTAATAPGPVVVGGSGAAN